MVLTKPDLACKHVETHLSHIYKSCNLTDIVDKVSSTFSLPRNEIYPLKCYEHEIKLVQNVGILALTALQSLVQAAESCLEDRAGLPTKGRSGSNCSGSNCSVNGAGGGFGPFRNRSVSDNVTARSGSPAGKRSQSATNGEIRAQLCQHHGGSCPGSPNKPKTVLGIQMKSLDQ